MRAERAQHAKHQRSGHLGELRKRRIYLQEVMKSPIVQVMEVENGLARYEEAFHKFVSSHDVYKSNEDDEEKRELMIDNYESQRDVKLQLEDLVNEWKEKVKAQKVRGPPSESSFKSMKSHSSSRESMREKKEIYRRSETRNASP